VEGHHALVLQHICVTDPQHELAGAMVCEVCSAADDTGGLAVLIILIKPTGLQGDISLLLLVSAQTLPLLLAPHQPCKP
jgi:Na+-translocating ferredoxin:NAD+ oxidoreductase RnfG subunit